MVPRIQTFRRPFLSRTVVMVAVDTRDRVAIASGVKDIWKAGSGRDELAGAILRGAVIASRAAIDLTDHRILSATC